MLRKGILVLVLFLAAATAFAQQDASITFEQQPNTSNAQTPVTIGVATFRGGLVARGLLNSRNVSAVYWTASREIGSNGVYCETCSRDVTIEFSRPVSQMSMTIYDGLPEIVCPCPRFYDLFVDDDPNPTKVWLQPLGDPNRGDEQRVILSAESIRRIRISPDQPNNPFWDYLIDDLNFVISRTVPFRLRTGFDEPGSTTTVVKEIGGKQVQQVVPLGRSFFLEVQKKDTNGNWVTLPSKFGPGNSLVSDSDGTDTRMFTGSLFRNYAVFGYGSATEYLDSRRFQPVHYGDVNIFIEPRDTAIAPLSVALRVGKPGQLGAPRPATGPRSIRNDTSFDARFMKYAHKTGIPPQYLKGQADQESELGIGIMDPKNYRYELVTKDNNFIQRTTCQRDPNGHDWNPYRCDQWANFRMPSGPQLCPAPPVPNNGNNCGFGGLDVNDVSARSRQDREYPYKIVRNGGQPRAIVSGPAVNGGDDPVMGFEIYYGSQDRHNFGIYMPIAGAGLSPSPEDGEDGEVGMMRRRAVGHPSGPPYNFVAETAIASSYGLLQVLWLTAIDHPLEWRGVNGRYNPALLFDTQYAEEQGAGSIAVGSRYDMSFFGAAQTPNFANEEAFTTAIQNMFRGYNRGDANYAPGVMAKSDRYAPQQQGSFFLSNSCSAPVVTSQTRSVILGNTALLGVNVSGDGPFHYDWFEDAPGQPSRKIATTDDPILTVTPASLTAYHVRITGECGSATSSTISVVSNSCTPPHFTQTPVDVTIEGGVEIPLSITTTGTNVTYQWYVGNLDNSVGGLGDTSHPVSGGDTPTIRVAPATTTSFWVVARNSCGSITAAVTVNVCTRPQISADPQSKTLTEGESADLRVVATSAKPMTIQWYAGTTPLANETSSLLRVTPSATTIYFARVINECGFNDSRAATITVVPAAPACNAPAITSQPQGGSITADQSAPLSLGVSGTAPLSIVWSTSSGAQVGTGASISVTPSVTTTYTARVTNACGQITSNPVTINVTPAPPACTALSIATQPQSSAITAGQSAPLSVTASGTAPLSYQWYANGAAINATSASFSVSPSSTTTYSVMVTNACGSVTSNPAIVTVTASCVAPSIDSPPQSSTITQGQSASLSVSAKGSSPLAIQWFTAAGAAAGSGATISVTPAATTSYFAHVSNSCGAVDSAMATVTVNPPACNAPAVTSQPASTTITSGQSATLSIAASGTAPLSYQWFTSAGVPAGSTSPTLTVSPTSTTSYYVRVANACGTVQSATVTVTVTAACTAPIIASQPQSATIAAGQSKTLAVTATGSATLSYQWSANGTAIPGATAASLTVTPAATTSYAVTVSNDCGSVTSAVAVISVCTVPSISTQPQNKTINAGESTTLTVGAAGTAPLSYQWYANGVAIAGATSHTVSVSPATTTSYTVTITNACGSVTSAVRTVTVCVPPSITNQPNSVTINPGQSTTLETEASGTDDLEYQWYTTANVLLSGQTSRFLTVSPSQTTSYYCRVTNGCGTATSNAAQVTVYVCEPLEITQEPADKTITAGEPATMTAHFYGSSPWSLQWYENGVAMPGRTAAGTTVFPTVTTTYYVRGTNPCGSVQSRTVTITVNP